MTLNDLTSSWAHINANWPRPSPSPFLQIYSSKLSQDRTTLRKDRFGRQRSPSPALQEFAVDATDAGYFHFKSLEDVLQGATKQAVSSKRPPGQREYIILDEDDEDRVEETRSGMTRFRRPESVFSGQDDLMMTDIPEERIRDESLLMIGSMPHPAQNKQSKNQVEDATQEREAKTQDLTRGGDANHGLTDLEGESWVDRVLPPRDPEPTSSLQTSTKDFQTLQPVGLVQDVGSTSQPPNPDPEPPNESPPPVNDTVNKVSTSQPLTPTEIHAEMTLHYNDTFVTTTELSDEPSIPMPPPSQPTDSSPLSSGYEAHKLFLAQELAPQSLQKQDELTNQVEISREIERDKERGRAAVRREIIENSEMPKLNNGSGAEGNVEVTNQGVGQGDGLPRLEAFEHEDPLGKDIRGVMTSSDAHSVTSKEQASSVKTQSQAPSPSPTQSRHPSPPNAITNSVTKEPTLQALSQTVLQQDTPIQEDETLSGAKISDSSSIVSVHEYPPPSALEADPVGEPMIVEESLSLEMDVEEMNEVEETSAVPKVGIDVDTGSRDRPRQTDEFSHFPADEHLPDAHEDDGRTRDIGDVREPMNTDIDSQPFQFDSVHITLSGTSDDAGNQLTRDRSGQKLSEHDILSIQSIQEETVQELTATMVQTSLPEHPAAAIGLSEDSSTTEAQRVSASPPPAPVPPNSTKKYSHAPIPLLSAPTLPLAVSDEEPVSVDVPGRHNTATPFPPAPIHPIPSPTLPHTFVEDSPEALPNPIRTKPSPIPPENENPVDRQTSPAFDARTPTTSLISSTPPLPATLSLSSTREPDLAPRHRSVSVVMSVPSPSQTLPPIPDMSTTVDSTPTSPTRPIRFKLKFNATPSPPPKRRRISPSKSRALPHPPPVPDREILECIIVRNDFENVLPPGCGTVGNGRLQRIK